MADIFNMTDLWDNAGTTYTSVKMNATNTASSASTLLMDLQVGGSSQFSVSKAGQVVVPLGSAAAPSVGIGNASTGWYSSNLGSILDMAASGNVIARFSVNGMFFPTASGQVQVSSGGTFGFSAGTAGAASADLILARDAANTLAQRNGVNAQAFRLYNTFTDASNYERGKFTWSSNVLQIGTEKAGTGTARALELQTDGATRWNIGTAGHLTAGADNTYDIGASGATRPRDIYVAGKVVPVFVQWSVGGVLKSYMQAQSTDGILTMLDSTGVNFNRLQFGGTTSAFPALKRSTTSLQVRLADDSGFGSLSALVDLTATQNASSLGTRGVPQNAQSANYTLVAADAGQHILHPSADTTARTFTIPANSSVAYPIGTVVTFINQNGGGVITIAITTDTMRLAGAGTTGSRTLAANGIATAIKVTSTEWLISGTNLT